MDQASGQLAHFNISHCQVGTWGPLTCFKLLAYLLSVGKKEEEMGEK